MKRLENFKNILHSYFWIEDEKEQFNEKRKAHDNNLKKLIDEKKALEQKLQKDGHLSEEDAARLKALGKEIQVKICCF